MMEQQIPVRAADLIAALERRVAAAVKDAAFWEAACAGLQETLRISQQPKPEEEPAP